MDDYVIPGRSPDPGSAKTKTTTTTRTQPLIPVTAMKKLLNSSESVLPWSSSGHDSSHQFPQSLSHSPSLSSSASQFAKSTTGSATVVTPRRHSISLNLTKPLRCTSLHQSMVPQSPELVPGSSPHSRRNSIASLHSASSSLTPCKTSLLATLDTSSSSHGLENRDLFISSTDPSAAPSYSSSDSDDEFESHSNKDMMDFGLKRYSENKNSFQHQKSIYSEDVSVSSPSTPNMFPPLHGIAASVTPSSQKNVYFPHFSFNDDEVISDQTPTQRLPRATLPENYTAATRLSYGFMTSTIARQTGTLASSFDEVHPAFRRAVPVSRSATGTLLKPQIRSFTRISRELADEFAPAEAEIKHEAEVTMSFRDDFDHDDDDDDDDDDDEYEYEEGFAGRTIRVKKRGGKKFQFFDPDISSVSSDGGSRPINAFKNGLLDTPPIRRRRAISNASMTEYLSDTTRADEYEDPNDSTDEAQRHDNETRFPMAGAGTSFTQAIKRPLDGWESPLSNSPVGSAAGIDRKLKRRGQGDDRFESYSIKRRAVSPSIVGAGSPTLGSPGSFAAGKRNMKQMQETYDRIQKMSLN
ncbi:hypothetical protein V1514DRAFT_328018 [Lipomyces japonicus]|uniref:uncharacterized protein n=1 Tax=Lipomyces japonicus TaxID=56871 RepID=UPI0034CEDF70